MENLRQYEFCHRLLEAVLVGGTRATEATPTSTSGKVEKKPSKWRLFHGKTSGEKFKPKGADGNRHDDVVGGEGKQVTFGKQTKQVKEKKRKKSSSSKKVKEIQ